MVDDEPQARELLSAIVENAGAEVRVAGSCARRASILPSWAPDVVLSDIEMPDEDGYVLMEQVRRPRRAGASAGRSQSR